MERRKYNSERGNTFLRVIDRYIGIPIVLFLGIIKRKRQKPDKIKNIALLKTAAIGDTVLLSAIIDDIKFSKPDAKITFFTGSSNYEIAKILAEEKNFEVIRLPVKNPIKAISVVKNYNFDVWLDFGPWPRFNAIISYFANAKYKVGFKTKNQYRHYVYDKSIEHSDKIHEVFNYKNILKAIGIDGKSLPKINLFSNVEKDEKLISIHMFPGGFKSHLKEWPNKNWIELINYLTDKGYNIALTGANSDKNRAIEVYNKCNNKHKIKVMAGKLGLKDTMLLLKKSQLVISINTGIMHLASALGCNLIALHGPTSHKRWGPLNKNSISLQSSLECSPCLNLGFEYGCNQNKCMKEIKVEDVLKATELFL